MSNSDRSGNITISDSTVYAQGGGSSCGIGYSKDISGDCNIVITGGTVCAVNGSECSNDDDGTSSIPTDGNGGELVLFCIDNPNSADVTINGKQYASETIFYSYLDSTSIKCDSKVYAYVPRSGLITVTVGSETATYIYSNDSFHKVTGFGLDICATDDNQELVYGKDYTYDSDTLVLTILSDKGITIKNIDPLTS